MHSQAAGDAFLWERRRPRLHVLLLAGHQTSVLQTIDRVYVLILLFCRHAPGCYVVLDSKVLHRLGIKTSRHTLHRASRQDADDAFPWERRRPRLHPPH